MALQKTSGRLLNWKGSWRKSYLSTFLLPASRAFPPFPTDEIRTPTLHSDVLFQPSLCASFDACSIFLAHSFTPSIPHIDGRGLTPSSLPSGPAILTGLMDDWAAMSSEGGRRWTLEDMKERFPTTLFRAEATLTSLPEYSVYHENCGMDESPLYLFESHFVEKTQNKDGTLGLGNDYQMPECFREDLFEVMKDERPDYRWLVGLLSSSRLTKRCLLTRLYFEQIVGPTRSGSTWHQDPNGTGAWNAVTVGVKAWVMFPPDVTPPGVHVSEDQGEVEAPLSLAGEPIFYFFFVGLTTLNSRSSTFQNGFFRITNRRSRFMGPKQKTLRREAKCEKEFVLLVRYFMSQVDGGTVRLSFYSFHPQCVNLLCLSCG